MVLGLPAILFTAYVQRTTRRVLISTPTLTPGGTPRGQGTIATMAIKASPHVSWRRTAMGGIGAVGALILLTGAWMGARAMGIGPAASLISSGKLSERERVILAEFKSTTADSQLGPTVTEAFRTDLAQSTSLSVMPAAAVRGVLQRMQRPTEMRVDYALAREIATREGIKAVIDGDIVSLGGSYVLSARLVSAQTGEDLATFRETADSDKDIIPAISRLSKSLRSKVGESLRTVQSAKTLDKVTTPSLDALQRYVAANRAIEVEGDFARFQDLMNEAISLDTGFAMAYRKLAVELSNRGLQRPRVEELLQKGYNHMDRLSDTERYILLGSYWFQGPKQDLPKAISALESLLEIDSTNVTALNNLAVFYHLQQEYAKQEAMSERAVRVQPTAAVFFNNLVHSRVHLGKLDAARQAISVAQQNIPRNPDVALMRTEVLEEEMKMDSADMVLDSLAKARSNDTPTVRNVVGERAAIRELQGKISDGARYTAQGRELARQMGNPQAAVNAILDTADYDSWYRDQRDRALRAVDRAAAHPAMATMSPNQKPLDRLVDLYARVGRVDKAQPLLQQMSQVPRFQSRDGQRSVAAARGAIARAEKRYDDAIREFRAAIGGGCPDCGLPELAITYDQAGEADSAIAIYTRYVQGRAISVFDRAPYLAFTHRRLAELYDSKANADSALSHYAQFVELWKGADVELQPQVQKARDRMRELQRRRG
jgi:tetratricopeptide (TPR) repeat protein